MSWEDFIHERLFMRLGMHNSYTSTPDLFERAGDPAPEKDIFIPARNEGGEVRQGDWKEVSCGRLYAPAGGIVTTRTDIAKWMMFLLQEGEINKVRLLSAEALQETWSPLVLLDPRLRGWSDPTADFFSGSLGWVVFRHQGPQVYEAPGGWMSSVVALVPEEALAVGVFTNAYFTERHAFESLLFVNALKLRVIDAFLGFPQRDWSALFKNLLTETAR